MWKRLASIAATLGVAVTLNLSAAEFPAPAKDEQKATTKRLKTAVLAGGCFWCTEAVFEYVDGVEKVVAGYSGGTAQTANYKLVSEGKTTHAEAIEITYDAAKTTYGTLLQIFFSVAHDPTQLNRQGPDWGPQYRSAIFYSGEEQKRIAEAYIVQLTEAKAFKSKIVTEVAPVKGFYPAEDYHQDYADNNPLNPYIQVNANPKLGKLKKQYPACYRKR